MKRLRSFLLTMLAVAMLCVSIGYTTAYAEERSTYTVVTDNASLFSSEQIAEIEVAAGQLELFDAAIYVENCDEKTCTQGYANELSKKMYNEVFGENKNGIIIVFSFYKEANGYYSVTYGDKVQIDESKVKRLIEGSYHDYPTDSTWVTGSFKQCTDYFSGVEYNIIHADEIAEQKAKEEAELKIFFVKFLKIAIEVIQLVVIACLIWNLYKNKKEYEKEISEKNKKIKAVMNENTTLQNRANSAENKVQHLENWKKDACEVYRDIQIKMDDMHARQTAKSFENRYKPYINCEAKAGNYSTLSKMIDEYKRLSKAEKTYVTIDMDLADEKMHECARLYAREAEERIERICNSCEGNRHYRSELENAVSYYHHVPSFVQVMIAANLVNRLNRMNDEAKKDYTQYRRRQERMHSSSSHSYGSSSFGGSFGGGGTFGGGFGGGH